MAQYTRTASFDTVVGAVTFDRGEVVSHTQAIRAAVTEAVLTDQAGVDVVASGERQRPGFAIKEEN